MSYVLDFSDIIRDFCAYFPRAFSDCYLMILHIVELSMITAELTFNFDAFLQDHIALFFPLLSEAPDTNA